jgi:hypothetical protein
MSVEVHGKVIAWGRYQDVVYVAELGALERLAEVHELVNEVLNCETWAEVGDVVDKSQLEKHLGNVLDDFWVNHCEDNDLGQSERPIQWTPEDENSGPPSQCESLWFGPQIDHPHSVNLPDDFFELGVGNGDMLLGDTWRWSESDLPQLAELAQQLGFAFEERQDLIDKCIG